ncbi:MAG: ABC transporter permease [Acidobacteriota bacterium]
MTRTLLKRIALFFPTTLAVVTAVFFLGRALPGDPGEILLGEGAAAEARQEWRRAEGLDRPLWVQYGRFLKGLARLDLGRSLRTGRPVARELGEAFPETLRLGTAALALTVLMAFPLALASSRSRGALPAGASAFTSASLALPSFLLGPLLLLFLAVEYPLFPVSGSEEPGAIFLPAFTLAVPSSAFLSRVLAAALREEEGREYLKAARARGLGPLRVFLRHALPNALPAAVTVLGLQAGALLTGAIFAEKIFRWPGLGSLTLSAIAGRDYPVVQGAVILFAVVTLAATLLADLAAAALDPRGRGDG